MCYRTICAEGARLIGPHAHPEISLHSHSLAADDYLAVFDSEASVRAITPDHTLLSQLTCEVRADRVILCGEAVTFMEAEISFGDRCHDRDGNGQDT